MTEWDQMAKDYIAEASALLSRMKELEDRLREEHMTAHERQNLIKRIALLEDMYWDTRSTGRQLLREYGDKKGA